MEMGIKGARSSSGGSYTCLTEFLITAVQPALLLNTVPNFLTWECPHHWEFLCRRHHHGLSGQQQKFLHTGCWSKRLQIWGVPVGPGANSWRRPESEGLTGWTVCPKPTGRETFLVCLCVQPTISQGGGMAVRHWGCSGLPRCHLCLWGCWKSPQGAGKSLCPPAAPCSWLGALPHHQLDLELQNQG